jgi:hypothetical protein
MKKKFSMLTVVMFLSVVTFGQTSNPGQQLADRLAGKMKDTLGLTVVQRQSIYDVNMQLHVLKMRARTVYTDLDLLQQQLQHIEYTRDSLYKMVLNVPEYQLYLQKKQTLISNN